MYDFWESILFGKAKYKGNPMLKHINLNNQKEIDSTHFNRWLSLWEQTVNENYEGKKSEEAVNKANQIATLMQFKIESTKNN